MLETEEYRRKLQFVLEKINKDFDFAEVRGSAVGSFIYAKKENRAVEIYQSDNSVIVEFWVNEEQQTEVEVNSYEKATKSVVDWVNK